jgi:hypothetical protein
MILAAAGCAEGLNTPPPVLELHWDCVTYHALPEPGGVRDQEAGLLRRMRILGNVFSVWQAWLHRRPGHEDEWIGGNQGKWQVVQDIRSLRQNILNDKG